MIKILKSAILIIPVLFIVSGTALALDPMRIQIRTVLPENTQTVGQAASYFAASIGYRLVTSHPAPPESRSIANELLNPLVTTNTVRPVEEAILALLRENYSLVIDHQHKLFSFELGGK